MMITLPGPVNTAVIRLTRLMKITRTYLLITLLLMTLCGTTARASNEWPGPPEWLGAFWQADAQLGELLGIDTDSIKKKFPSKLELSNFADKEAAVAVLGETAFASVEDRFKKMNHKVVAGGKWTAGQDFEGFGEKDEFFFVTQFDGATFVWFGTPQETLKGAEVHYIHGKTTQHDLLILDFGFTKHRARLYAGNTVGYRRTKD